MNPWDIAPPADYPRSNVIPMAAARPRGRGNSRSVRAIDVARVARATRDPGMLAALAERAEEAGWDDFVRADGRTRLGTPADPFARLNKQVGTMSDPALGGTTGIVIMTLVAAFVGALLACGGVL